MHSLLNAQQQNVYLHFFWPAQFKKANYTNQQNLLQQNFNRFTKGRKKNNKNSTKHNPITTTKTSSSPSSSSIQHNTDFILIYVGLYSSVVFSKRGVLLPFFPNCLTDYRRWEGEREVEPQHHTQSTSTLQERKKLLLFV